MAVRPWHRVERRDTLKSKVCFPFVGDSVGGAQISTLLLAERIRRERYTPLIVLHREGPLSEHLSARGIHFELLHLDRFAGARPGLVNIAAGMLQSFPVLHRYIRARGIRIVHANDIRMNLSWALPARVSGAGFIWHQRTQPNSRSRIWSLLPLLATKTISISNAVAQSIRQPPESVIYNPFDLPEQVLDREEAHRALTEALGISNAALVLGFAGRLVGYKRPDLCLRILKCVSARIDRDTHLVFAGKGSEQEIENLRSIARGLGIESRIHILGFKYPVEPVLAGLDILLAPSETEGFGRALVETMLVGTPVVASALEAHQEIIRDGETGIIAELGNEDAFAAGVLKILSNPDGTADMVRRALDDVTMRFSTEAHVAAVCRVYDRLPV